MRMLATDGSLNVGLPAIFGGLIDILSDILGVNILSSQGDALYTAITESAMKKPPSYPGTTKANTLAGKCGLEAVSTVTYEQQVKYDETSKEIEGAIAVADDADAGLDDSEGATGMKSGNFRTYKKSTGSGSWNGQTCSKEAAGGNGGLLALSYLSFATNGKPAVMLLAEMGQKGSWFNYYIFPKHILNLCTKLLLVDQMLIWHYLLPGIYP